MAPWRALATVGLMECWMEYAEVLLTELERVGLFLELEYKRCWS